MSLISRTRLAQRSAARALRCTRVSDLRGTALWALPLATIWVVYFSPQPVLSADKAITYLLAMAAVLIAARRPDRCLLALIVLLPFQGLLLAELWGLGVPGTMVRHLAACKEILAIAVVLAGARGFLATGRRADTLDRLALGFVGVAALYAALQPEIVQYTPSSTSVRLLGFRETAGFVLLLLGARHAPLGAGFIRRAGCAMLVLGVIVSAVGVFEAVFSSGWNHFVVNTIGYTRYQEAILHGSPPNALDIRIYGYIGGARALRIGSVFLDPASFSWYLLPPFAIAVERTIRRETSLLVVPALLLIGAAELLTQTRSAILGALIIAVLSFPLAAGRRRHWRTQVGILLTALTLMAVPAAIGIGVGKRVTQVTQRGNADTSGHITGFFAGLSKIAKNPLGEGLGTAAGTGQRFNQTGLAIPENNYLEVGDELGIAGGLLFVVLTCALIVWLRRLSRTRADPLVAAMWTAGIGLAVAAWFLQTWEPFAVAWTFWGVAGATLGAARARVTAAAEADGPTSALDDVAPTMLQQPALSPGR